MKKEKIMIDMLEKMLKIQLDDSCYITSVDLERSVFGEYIFIRFETQINLVDGVPTAFQRELLEKALIDADYDIGPQLQAVFDKYIDRKYSDFADS